MGSTVGAKFVLRTRLALALSLALPSAAEMAGRESVKFDFAWRFQRGPTAYNPSHLPEPLPNAPESAAGFDDSSWDIVDAPHDFLIGLQYNKSGDKTEGAYLPRGEGWYRKHFKLPQEWKGRSVWLYFEGVWQVTTMWLNGAPVRMGNHTNGYTSFAVRLDNQTKVGFGDSRNVLAVHVDAKKGSGWWYEGGGIYRHVNLVTAPLLHIIPDGLFAPAKVLAPVTNGQTAQASIDARATVTNDGTSVSSNFVLRFDVFDTTGKKVASAKSHGSALAPGATTTVAAPVALAPANVWSTARPYLYKVKATLVVDDADSDSANETVGFRSTTWTADDGFSMNGEHFKIHGFCDHNDFGGVGMAVADRIHLYKAQALRSVSARPGRRMSHNPPQPSALDIYDRVGVVVMNENRNFADTPAVVADHADLVRRDRNHPSVVIWSFCNEGGCNGPHNTNTTGAGFHRVTQELDGTRPTMGNEEGFNLHGLQQNTEVQGFSHRYQHDFDAYHKCVNTSSMGRYKNGSLVCNVSKPTVASECCSCPNVGGNIRGETFQAGCIAGQTNASNGLPYMAGTFVWTLHDYYGEARAGWPSIAASFGSFDLAGFEKGGAWWYRSWWRDAVEADDPPAVKSHAPRVCRVWNDRWDSELVSKSGKINVNAVTASPFAELFVDGKSQGVEALRNPTLPALNNHHKGGTAAWAVTVLAEDAKLSHSEAGPAHSDSALECTGANSSFPIDLKNLKCIGLRPAKGLKSYNASSCAEACCKLRGCAVWNLCSPEGCRMATSGSCWIAPPGLDISTACTPGDAQAGWVSRGRDGVPTPPPTPRKPTPATPPKPPTPAPTLPSVRVRAGSNLTLICRSGKASGAQVTGVHTVIAPGPAAALRLYIDAPNVSKGTGEALLLDGQDVALVRAEVVDAQGNLVTGTNASSAINVTFSVVAGPGRVIASHNGDPKCHEPNLSPSHTALHGLVRSVIQVTHDAASTAIHRERLTQIDLDGNKHTTIARSWEKQADAPTKLTVTASSSGLAAGSIDIPLSTNAAVDSVLAAAAASRSGAREQLVW